MSRVTTADVPGAATSTPYVFSTQKVRGRTLASLSATMSGTDLLCMQCEAYGRKALDKLQDEFKAECGRRQLRPTSTPYVEYQALLTRVGFEVYIRAWVEQEN